MKGVADEPKDYYHYIYEDCSVFTAQYFKVLFHSHLHQFQSNNTHEKDNISV